MSDLIQRLSQQAELDDAADRKARADAAQPVSMCAVGDGALSSLESLGDAPDAATEKERDLKFRSSPDRQRMNYDVAQGRFVATRQYGAESPERRSEMLAAAAASFGRAQGLAESPIESYILPWLIFQDCRPFGEAPIPVFRPDSDTPPAVTAPMFIVPQLAFGRYRLDFGIVTKRYDRSLIIGLECDGIDFHDARSDQQRDAYFAGFGIPIVRAGGREIKERPDLVVARVLNIIEAWSRRR